jgi:hypothetical protein
MQLGRALIGAIIGAAVGIAVLVAVYMALKFDSVWLALVVAVLTGLGVRMMVATGGHASYLRGAVTGLIALGAYLFGSYLVAAVMQAQAAKAAEATRVEQPAASAKADEAADADAATAETPPVEEPKAPPPSSRPVAGGRQKMATPKNWSTLDYILLCVSALVAYELGRGTAAKTVVVGEETVTEVPQGTHPDA